ncbi:electron transfer flavoprotein subunit beta/FixA family protein [Corynebacterium sp. ACRQM]|jgi:electron transfer flavoprotein beta subunit|uniref:electron transfer flavoprotein subunit beta/FixA family protein n=1 Tax=Corynebacterium TaxID=1716 RepID=UPI001EF67721|nr:MULTISPECIES: electron transfer flavoprotein subunit beta/FixA family protein [Corynebacterium]MCG7271106.1 electron transfer flavoprotein subunit beta/FixA family protein [Corynebacterium sp. ACRQM]MCG7233401.1 electron transfer flavoprotein subunit beta/FixA family protein [Corynebacterium sp. ACRPR]MDK4268171.1 electron transfer flavoprotein subunit beta/FixA family protein [Corynebacterium accolens]MDK8473047.1 electron transfer flavoprotein subunit beta/FixA family protein [Corynebacter
MPTIVALVKHVPDTWSTKSLEDDHTLDRTSVDNIIDEINEYSVEQALRLRDENPDENYRVVALTMGPAQADEALRKALAMGADDAVLVSDDALAGADALSTAWTLNAAINTLEDVQLITLGNEASDASTGTLAGLLAEYRQLPALTELQQVELSGGAVKGSREDARGTWVLEAALPAIISVTDKADKPRFPNFKGLMAAKKAEITTLSVADLGIDAIAPTTTVTESSKRPPRTAGEVISEPQPQDAAKKIADFLAAKNLI